MRKLSLLVVTAIAMLGVTTGCTGGSTEIERPDTSDIEVTKIAPPPGAGTGNSKAVGAAPD